MTYTVKQVFHFPLSGGNQCYFGFLNYPVKSKDIDKIRSFLDIAGENMINDILSNDATEEHF